MGKYLVLMTGALAAFLVATLAIFFPTASSAVVSYMHAFSGNSVALPISLAVTVDSLNNGKETFCQDNFNYWALGFETDIDAGSGNVVTLFTDRVPSSTLTHTFTLSSLALADEMGPLLNQNYAISNGTGIKDIFIQCFDVENPTAGGNYRSGGNNIDGDGRNIIFTITDSTPLTELVASVPSGTQSVPDAGGGSILEDNVFTIAASSSLTEPIQNTPSSTESAVDGL